MLRRIRAASSQRESAFKRCPWHGRIKAGLGQTFLQFVDYPVAGFRFAVAEYHDARLDVRGKVHQFITLRVRREIKRLHGAVPCQFAAAIAEAEGNARLAGFETAAG